MKRLLFITLSLVPDVFLPNTDSFILIRRPIVKPAFPVFLPNTDSFILIRRAVVKPAFPSEAGNAVAVTPQSVASTDSEQPKVNPVRSRAPASGGSPEDRGAATSNGVKDRGKRNFLKAAGVSGAALIASQLLSAKKAQALILGSSPTTGVVGVKDSDNARINPATEETISTLLKPSDLTFDAGSLKVKVTSTSGEGSSSFSNAAGDAKSGLVDELRHVQVDVLEGPPTASTEDTLEKISFGGVKFALRLATDSGDSNIDYVGEATVGTLNNAGGWRIKRMTSSASGIVIEWANGTDGFDIDHIWNNRESLTYS